MYVVDRARQELLYISSIFQAFLSENMPYDAIFLASRHVMSTADILYACRLTYTYLIPHAYEVSGIK